MNYWNILIEARTALEDGRFRDAETAYETAAAARSRDGRRVFFSETLPDGAKALWRRVRGQEPAGPESGRWDRASAAFRENFRVRSGALLRRAEEQLDLDISAEPDAAFAALDAALYLSVGSRLAERRLAASPLLVSLFRLLPLTGRLCAPDLVTADLDLDAATRMDLADAALDGLPRLAPDERDAWAGIVMGLLGADGCEWTPSQNRDRRWQRARLADHHRRDPAEVLACWRACDDDEQTEPRRQWSRLRRLEILAGRDPRSLPVPRYAEAHQLARLLPCDGEDEAAVRTRDAMAVVEYRRPRTGADQGWISAAASGGGAVQVVFWWGDEPRDAAAWSPDDDPDALAAFLEAAHGRVIWAGELEESLLDRGWPAEARGRDVSPYLEAVLEPLLPPSGWTAELGERLALARSGAWRDGWRADLGHPLLSPPGADGRLASGQSAIEPALRAGLLWLAVLHRVDTADPALRAGFGELGRRGDPAAAFLHACAVLGAADKAVVDDTFEAWTMPLLWTRPDPLTGARRGGGEELVREDLAGQDVAVVATARPGRVLDAWSPGERRWRVVLDRLDRLPVLKRQVREAYGPVTIVPRTGRVHDLRASLDLLDDLAAEAGRADDPVTSMLAICHWIRLVETHNGDLLDDRMMRPRPAGSCPIHDRYAARIADLPCCDVAGDHGDDGGWGDQYSQRVRRSGLVAGLVDQLPEAEPDLDALWGVFDGSDACWVFLDSAAVHWTLQRRDPAAAGRLHALLAPRGRRHLSLVSNRGPLPEDLSTWLDNALAVYGRPYHLTLDDQRSGTLRLAGAGPLPHARLRAAEAWSAPLAHLDDADPGTIVRAPAGGLAAAFWTAAADGEFGPVSWTLERTGGTDDANRLVVPRLVSLAPLAATVAAVADTPEAWRAADERRVERIGRCRRLAALECSALLAEPVDCIEVLDTGWWRLLGAAGSTPATMLDGAVGVELFEPGSGAGGAALRKLREPVSGWLGERGVVPGLLPGWDGPPLADAGKIDSDGRFRHRAPATALWRDLAADMLAAWEHGTTVPRLLVVGETPPAGASAMAATCCGAGAATLDVDADVPLGPLVWARPDVLLARLCGDLDLPEFDRALVLDLERYLPGGRDAEGGGRLLGWLSGDAVRRLDLVGGVLPPAWSRFLAERLGVSGPPKAADEGGWTELRRGEIPRPRRRCPQCGVVAAGAVDGLVCPECGYHLADAAGPWIEDVPMAMRARQLLARADQGRDEPLEIWGETGDLEALAVRARDAGAQVDQERPGAVTLADGRRWRLRTVGEGFADGAAVLLRAPRRTIDLRPEAAPGNRDSLTLLYDRLDIAVCGERPAAAATRDLLRVLADGAWREGGDASTGRSGASGSVSSWRLAWLSGMATVEVGRSLDLLRWAAALEGTPISMPARGSAGTWRLLVRVDVRDLELTLAGLAARVESTLGPMMAGGLPGAWREATAPTAETIGADEIPRPGREDVDPLDRVLALAAGWTLAGGGRLLYDAPDGAWFRGRRRVGWLGDGREVAADLVRELDGFAHWIRTVLYGEGRKDAGDAVDVSAAGDPETGRWILLGHELGFWTVADPAAAGFVRAADLERIAEMPIATAGGAAAVLLAARAAEDDRWRERLVRTPAGGALVPVAGDAAGDQAVGPARPWWRRGEPDPLDTIRARVAGCLADDGAARLVLAGPMGSGRTDGLVAGLVETATGRSAEIWCPDVPTAVRLHLAARRADPTWQPRIRTWRDGDPLPVHDVAAPGERRVLVVAELPRFPRAAAYRLQEIAREGALVMTVDAAEVPGGDAWEGLFLTTPRQDELLRLQTQLLQARQPWRVTRPLASRVKTEARTARRERGAVESRRAGTLDECAATIAAATAAGRLDELVAVTVPLQEDVPLLARAFADCGWAAVGRDRLESTLLPGALELTAAMADAHCRRHGAWPGSSNEATRGDGPWLLSSMMPAVAAADWGVWLRSLPDAVLDDATAFAARMRRSPWGAACLAAPEARAGAEALLAAGGAAPGDLLDPDLWQAWRRRVALLLARPDVAPPRPVATLSAASGPVGDPCSSGVSICFGPEPPDVHRRILSGITDRILVLYQEHSPLPGERDRGGGA